MKSFKKNQIVIYTFALMLVAAGYLNYTSKVNKDSLETANQETYVSENETSDIGDAKLVNSNDVVDENDKTNENVEENITLPLSLDNREVNKNKLDELINTLGLQNRRTHLPNELSGGQQQRTSIGRAMITNPAIILADEPTGNLDSKASDEIISLLKLSNKKFNQTVVIITHDLEIAKEAERVITIEDGKIIKDEKNFAQ